MLNLWDSWQSKKLSTKNLEIVAEDVVVVEVVAVAAVEIVEIVNLDLILKEEVNVKEGKWSNLLKMSSPLSELDTRESDTTIIMV